MKLITIIKRNASYILNGRVCICYFRSNKAELINIDSLTDEQLNEKWYSSEWWIEDGDLCLMRGR